MAIIKRELSKQDWVRGVYTGRTLLFKGSLTDCKAYCTSKQFTFTVED